ELLSTIINEELEKINFTEDDITPIYHCKKCQDSGTVDGIKCQCYLDIIDALNKRELNSNTINKKGLSDIDDHIIKDEQKPIYNKLLGMLKETVKSFPNIARNFIVFCGATGSGKTYLANAMMCDFENKGFKVLSMSAFALNNAFLKYHTTFDGSAIDILQPIFNCDILMIDDLGTEPFFKNITNEYLISVINERTKVGKLTLVTTNLDSEKIIVRYSSRIASRLSDVNCSRVIDFNFDDLRYPKID
ncbi:MAG: ATP-binding protein, partial [Clostridia bacterium]